MTQPDLNPGRYGDRRFNARRRYKPGQGRLFSVRETRPRSGRRFGSEGALGKGSLHCLDEMRSVGRRRKWLRPELDEARDLASRDGEERNGPRDLGPVGDRHVRDNLHLIAEETIRREAPAPVGWILVVHTCEALCAADAFFRLRPLEYELG